MPSWTPELEPETNPGEEHGDTEPESSGGKVFAPRPLPPKGVSSAEPLSRTNPSEPTTLAARNTLSERPSTEPEPNEKAPAPDNGPYRYVLLGAYAEGGTAPPGLQTPSGMLAIELPENSRLTTLFKPGRDYRFTSDLYDAHYRVLDAYPTAVQAFMMYPEGIAVDPAKGEYLHWRKLNDPTSSDVTAWIELR